MGMLFRLFRVSSDAYGTFVVTSLSFFSKFFQVVVDWEACLRELNLVLGTITTSNLGHINAVSILLLLLGHMHMPLKRLYPACNLRNSATPAT